MNPAPATAKDTAAPAQPKASGVPKEPDTSYETSPKVHKLSVEQGDNSSVVEAATAPAPKRTRVEEPAPVSRPSNGASSYDLSAEVYVFLPCGYPDHCPRVPHRLRHITLRPFN